MREKGAVTTPHRAHRPCVIQKHDTMRLHKHTHTYKTLPFLRFISFRHPPCARRQEEPRASSRATRPSFTALSPSPPSTVRVRADEGDLGLFQDDAPFLVPLALLKGLDVAPAQHGRARDAGDVRYSVQSGN